MDTVYLNHAATSFPKPKEVLTAVRLALSGFPGDESRGGGGHDERSACRTKLAELFGVNDPVRVVLLPSATYAINLVINGLLGGGGHVVTTVLEHNSVLRPLAHRVRDLGVSVKFIEPNVDGRIDPAQFSAAIDSKTTLVILTHASNFTGCIQPVEDVAEIAASAGVPMLVDAAQTAGAVGINHKQFPGRFFVAFAGHKGLLGPAGTGGLILPDDELSQLTVGGTGIRSESTLHPSELPLRHEAGTPNHPGIAGLLAGVQTVLSRGVDHEGDHRHNLVQIVREAFAENAGVHLLPLADADARAGIVAFTLRGWTSEMLSFVLRESFHIETRAGLHCAPLAHVFFGTSPDGAVRASFGGDNCVEHAEALVEAICDLQAV